MNRIVWAIAGLAGVLCPASNLIAQGTAFTYQGQLMEAGLPAAGNYDMVFRVFDADVGGTQYGADFPLAGVSASEGLFTATIDFGAGVFTGVPLWLEIEVNATVLAPRQSLTATPYAQTCNDSYLSTIASYSYYAYAPWVPLGSDLYYLDGNVGIGTTTPTAKLEVAGEAGVDGIRFPDGTLQTTASGPGGGPWQSNGSDVWYGGGGVGIIGGSSPFPSGMGVFLEGGSATSAQVFAYNYNALAPLSLILNAPGGNVGIGTTSPSARLHVAGSSGNTILTTTSGGRGLSGTASSNFGGTGVYGEHLQALNSGSLGTLDAGVTGIAQVSVNYGGNFINTDAGGVALRSQGLLDVVGSGAGTELLRFNTERPWVFRQIYTGPSTGLQLKATSGLKNFEITCTNDVNVATFLTDTVNPRVGIGTTTPVATLDVNGTTRTRVLQIVGADLAEKFPTSGGAAEPGTVMEIDPANPGLLRQSQGAYNQRVAGVVSGANDFPAGAILGNLPGHDDAPPIALSGRVWTWCDAGETAIGPGDLLTTSDTPGHAMKAADRNRSHGAVIGKAMTSLKSGRGLVLVLVNLQ